MNNHIDILRKLAKGPNSTDKEFDAEETLGNSWIEKKEMFMQRSKGLATDVRLAAFQDEMKDYHFTRANVDSYYETFAELFPGSPQKAEDYTLTKLLDEVAAQPSDLAKENWTQENLSRVPTKWYDRFGKYFTELRAKRSGQLLERTRLTSITRAKKKYEEPKIKEKKIDTSKSTGSLIRGIVNADAHGLIDTLDVDEDGDYTVNSPDGVVKAYTLADIKDPITMFIAWHDLAPDATKFVSGQMEQSLLIEKEEEDMTTGQMRKNLTSFPDDFQANTIVDYALMQDAEKPADHMRGALRDIVSADIKAGKLTSPDEIVWKYKTKRDDVLNSYLGRRLNG